MVNEQVSAARQDDQRGNTPQQNNRHFLLLAFSRLPLSLEALSQLGAPSPVPRFPPKGTLSKSARKERVDSHCQLGLVIERDASRQPYSTTGGRVLPGGVRPRMMQVISPASLKAVFAGAQCVCTVLWT